ncbi:N-acetylmuramoyl-L-alanine amidase family protein [Priestia flexa]|uniref:N-acetylmuramoyl-L-alanine amidase family protein n=1 Tax=Priestia flexa TaxID=86664 RepID=UPI00099D4ECC|nr:N-acetylmuramoyl-L-alanine amidase [Priestia flexa]
MTRKPEYVLNLEAAFLLEELLTEKGFEVYLTRSAHDVDISNKERAEMANEKKADLVIRLHADGAENPNVSGFGFSFQARSKQSPNKVKAQQLSL